MDAGQDRRGEAAVDKPPYGVPSMADVARVRGTNGLRLASTFSGCGGSCLGFEMAGYEVRFASEFVPAARDVYRANHPGVHVDERDVRQLTAEELLAAAGLGVGELDVLEGSPPCASFSTAGKRDKAWGQEKSYSDTRQRTDDLFFEFARLLAGARPRAFVAENVSGLVKGRAVGYFKLIFAELERAGYLVESRMRDAQWLGVPQTRQRIIFQGVRRDLADLGLRPCWPTPLPYRYSVRDACPWIGVAMHETGGEFSVGDVTDRPSPAVTDGHRGLGSSHYRVVESAVIRPDRDGRKHVDMTREPAPTVCADRGMSGARYSIGVAGDGADLRLHIGDGPPNRRVLDMRVEPAPTITTGGVSIANASVRSVGDLVDPETGESIDVSHYAIGRELARLRPGQMSDRYYNLRRAHPEKPCGTVTAGGGNVTAASVAVQRRKFTLLELRRICGFPDDFVLTGTYAQRWERLGRAVPPPMMRAVAEALRDGVLLPYRAMLADGRAADNPSRARSTGSDDRGAGAVPDERPGTSAVGEVGKVAGARRGGRARKPRGAGRAGEPAR